mmetsp:Transcript_22329/g.51151  ORF Transcript_22329/g.51151 Transcript_22329/m.51151 type:complete len:226 (-) Transcript_22329:2692-3369(-)
MQTNCRESSTSSTCLSHPHLQRLGMPRRCHCVCIAWTRVFCWEAVEVVCHCGFAIKVYRQAERAPQVSDGDPTSLGRTLQSWRCRTSRSTFTLITPDPLTLQLHLWMSFQRKKVATEFYLVFKMLPLALPPWMLMPCLVSTRRALFWQEASTLDPLRAWTWLGNDLFLQQPVARTVQFESGAMRQSIVRFVGRARTRRSPVLLCIRMAIVLPSAPFPRFVSSRSS